MSEITRDNLPDEMAKFMKEATELRLARRTEFAGREAGARGDLLSFQAEVHEWSQATFPHQTPESKYAHLKREIAELGDNLADGEEMADCFLLLAGLAHMNGVDLMAAARRKLEINKTRQWGKPDSEGVSSHLTLPGWSGGIRPCGHCGKFPIPAGNKADGYSVRCIGVNCPRPSTSSHETLQGAIDEWNEETV